jgi:hypothetical protein
MKLILPALLLVLVLAPVAAPQDSPRDSVALPPDSAQVNVFRSEMAGIEIAKPASWHFANLQSVMENRASVKMKDEDFQKQLAQLATAPLVAATKYEEPYEALNPSFQIIVRPAATLEGKSGLEIMHLVEPGLRNNFSDFKVIEAARECVVSGRPAGRLSASYTVASQDGRTFPTRTTLVMIPRGKVLYQIGFSGPAEGPDMLTKEIEEILGSIKWLD